MRNLSLGLQQFLSAAGIIAVISGIILYVTQPWISPSATEGWQLRNDELILLFNRSADSSEKLIPTLPDTNEQAVVQETSPKQVDLNKATLAELDSLPGIGPAKAQAILDYREKAGQFHSAEELLKVKGIGTKIYETIRKNTRLEPQ